MQASGMLTLSDPVTSFGMLWSSCLSFMTSVAAVCFDGTGRSSRSHHSLLIAMVGGGSCHYVVGECANVFIKRGPVGVGEREFLYASKDSDLARWLRDNDEESWPLLMRQGC